MFDSFSRHPSNSKYSGMIIGGKPCCIFSDFTRQKRTQVLIVNRFVYGEPGEEGIGLGKPFER